MVAFLVAHKAEIHDVLMYLCFVLGQWLFVLKRAGSAIRNVKATVTSRREYVYHNWDNILIRGVAELLVIFYPFHRLSLAQILSFFGWAAAGNFTLLSGVVESIPGLIALGYCSDSLLDWLAVNPKVPLKVRTFILEKVPKLNGDS